MEAILCPLAEEGTDLQGHTEGEPTSLGSTSGPALQSSCPHPLPHFVVSYLEADIVVAALILSKVGAALAAPGPGEEAQGQRISRILLSHRPRLAALCPPNPGPTTAG